MTTSTKHFKKAISFSLEPNLTFTEKICLAWRFTLIWHWEKSTFTKPLNPQKRKGLAVPWQLSRCCSLGMWSHRGSRMCQPGPLPQPGVAQQSTPSPDTGHYPGERDGPGWDRTSVRGVVRSAVLPGWGVAVVQLEWQLWDSPAPSQAPTVTVLQRTRAQLVPSLKGSYLKIRLQNVELP